MNLWIPQNEHSKAECATILSTASNFLSSQDSKPLIGLKQDGMTGGYLLTYGYQQIDKAIFMEILTTDYFEMEWIFTKIDHLHKVFKHTLVPGTTKSFLDTKIEQLNVKLNAFKNKLENKIEYNKQYVINTKEKISKAPTKELKEEYKKDLESNVEHKQNLKDTLRTTKLLLKCKKSILEKAKEELLYTGHSLFSFLLPNDFEYYCKNNISPDGTQVYVSRGVLLSGTLNKSALGNISGSLIHHLAKDYGNKKAIEFVSYYEMMINDFLIHRGFSIGIADCIPKNTDLIEKEIDKCLLEASVVMTNETDRDIVDTKVNSILNKAATIGQRIAKEALEPTNNLVSMIKSGAKGNDFNVTQVTGLVGQQNVGGLRIAKSFGGRTLPHYVRNGYFKDSADMIPKNTETNPKVLKDLFESRGFVMSSFFKGLKPAEMFFHAQGGREGIIDTACKSVTSETLLVIIENNIPRMVRIGDWIDSHLDNALKNTIE